MSKKTWVVASIFVAIALFAAGALGPLRPGRSGSAPVVVDVPALGAPLIGAGLDQTIAGLQQRLEVLGDDAHSWAQLGLAYLQKARISADPTYYPRAERTLKKSLAIEATYEGTLGTGILAAARHDFFAAVDWGRRAARINPQGADAQGVIGDALLETGRYAAAGRAFQRMVDLKPNVASYARASYFRELHGDVAGAIDAMRSALRFAGTPADAAWVSYQIGDLHMNSGRVQAARRFYDRADALAPDFPPARAGLAKVAAANGRFGRAAAVLSDVVDVYPSVEYVTMLGDALRRAGRPDEAQAPYDLVGAIASLYAGNGVNTDLETAIFLADHGRARHALRSARRAYEVRPGVQGADALAWALYAHGKYRAAARYSEEALRLGTRSALFQFHAGMIAVKRGDVSAARAHLARSLDINPNFSFLYGPRATRVLHSLERRDA